MKKILIIDNFDSFTFNLADYFKQLGCEVAVYRNTIEPSYISVLNPDAIVFSPGPSVPRNAGNMLEIIKKYHKHYPMLGVCLGHQAMIECFGGSLKFIKPVHGESSRIEHDGKTIFRDIPQNFSAGRYHSLAASKVPGCFDISARHKNVIMAIRHKTLPLEGVQFHPESVLTMKSGNGLKIIKNFLDTYLISRQRGLPLQAFLEKGIKGQLSIEEQEAFLMSCDTVTPQELKDAVNLLHNQMPEQPSLENAIDICGTGGSGLPRINTSTISAFILASLGVKVAKHGNKAASGRFGSFDLLASLDVGFENTIDHIETLYRSHNLAFLYARQFHPVMARFAEVRKKIGKHTFFNILGPLLNPANVKKQIIGTAFRDKMELIAETCRLLGKQHVYVVCGEDGLDEVTLTGKTYVCELYKGKTRNYTITPEDFGLHKAEFSEISGGDGNTNTKLAVDILTGKCRSRHADLVLINSALALKLAGKVKTLKEGYRAVKTIMQTGTAHETYEQVKLLSHAPGLLLKIIDNKVKEVNRRKKQLPLEKIKKSLSMSKRDFKKALQGGNTALIAEIKRRSPLQGNLLRGSFSVRKLAQLYENAGAHAISILCDKKFFEGSLHDLKQVRSATKNIPLLCKDFIIDEYQIYEARFFGADAILLIATLLTEKQLERFTEIARRLHMDVICEVHTLLELEKVLTIPADIIGINNRDLHTFKIDTATAHRLFPHIPKGKTVIVESGITSISDIDKLQGKADAVLVGTSLMRDKDKKGKLSELLGKQKLLKICGIRTLKEAKFCEQLGVHFIGFNFVKTSKRSISPKGAQSICDRLKKIRKVGIFQNQPVEEVNKIAQILNLDFIQLSGAESLTYVKECARPVIKTINVHSCSDINAADKFLGHVAYILFDGAVPGSGKPFDHTLLTNGKGPFLIAGGIDSRNVQGIIKGSHARGIDVASGVETEGKIDLGKIRRIYNILKICS